MRKIAIVLGCIVSVFAIYLGGCLLFGLSFIPKIYALKTVNPETTSFIQYREKEAIKSGRAVETKRTYVQYNGISPYLRNAVISQEDIFFYRHKGVNYFELKDAIRKNLSSRSFKSGASTITQQLAKNLFLSPKRSVTRKIVEFVITEELELILGKRRILELYLNYIEWGDQIYGCEEAAKKYFGISAKDLNPEQAIRMTAMIINPRVFTPYSERLDNQRRMISWKMLALKYITQNEFEKLPFQRPLKTPAEMRK